MKFNQIYEYPLLSVFCWNMLTQASLLIAIQYLLVKPKIHSSGNFFLLKIFRFFFLHFKVGRLYQSVRTEYSDLPNYLDGCRSFDTL